MSAAALDAAETPRTLDVAGARFFRHASPCILGASLSLAVVARVVLADFSLLDLVPVAGIALLWPLNEWLIHVFVLHYKPVRIGGRTLDFAVARKHRAHHRDPRNLEILFIPLRSFVYTMPLLWLAAFAIAPTPQLALTAVATYLALALHYEWIHFLAHTAYRPRTAHYRRVLQHHRLHHFRSEKYWYGVSMLGADRPLGTQPDPADVEVSPTCRTLGV